jgi:hypothetical protein
MANSTDMEGVASGLAALSICESLLLALSDLKIMSDKDVDGLLEDAAEAHRNAASASKDATVHQEVVAIIERIKSGGNAIPPT